MAGNLLILVVLVAAGVLATWAPEHYYRAVQEDGYLEWASFWAFALAAVTFVLNARTEIRAARTLPWFTVAVSAFCLVVALEEISWGQRLVGYRPPTFFLEHNYQQEFNVHNVLAGSLRQLGVELVIAGYGIVLPVAMHVRVIGTRLAHWGVVSPPMALVPAFAAMLALYLSYPWDFSGEWIELTLGLAFLFAASMRHAHEQSSPRSGRAGVRLVSVSIAVAGLGIITTVAQDARATGDPQGIAATRLELDALAQDLKPLLIASACGTHKRLYTLARDREWDALRAGRFAGLAGDGIPEARITYFLDPWNSPYWLRERCAEAPGDQRIALLYSFGPNRTRDSSEHEIAGDDIGTRMVID